MKIQLTQQIIINNKHRWYSVFDVLYFKSKNLYNYALYQIRQYYKNTNKYLSYYKYNTLLSKENQIAYRSLLYAQCGQQILRQIDKQYLSFYKVLKSPKCNCDVLNIVPADKRYVYNPVRIKINSIPLHS